MYIDLFINHLAEVKKASSNTIEAYRRDILHFEKYLLDKGNKGLDEAEKTDVTGYLLKLKEDGKSSSTINRHLASLRKFYSLLLEKGYRKDNPATDITVPRGERKELEYLTVEEVTSLLELPGDTPSGKRDRAILELMYATGMRVSEVIEARVSDVNTAIGFMSFDGSHGRARIVPMGSHAKAALVEYISQCREAMLKGRDDHGILFVNYCGEPLTRQGLWKIIKEYGKRAGLEDKINPHILRTSFAVHMIENGADLKSLQEMMGHEEISAAQIYMMVKKSRIKDIYDMAHPRA